MTGSEFREHSAHPPAVFATTHWSIVLAAGGPHSADSHQALEQLCRTYWYPLYAYLRRRGHTEHDAQDLTQGFIAQLLVRGSLARISAERGKFRSFLLASLNFFVADQRDREKAAKRGGGQSAIALDALEAEERYRLEPIDDMNAERVFERRWAITVLDEVMQRLRSEFEKTGNSSLFGRYQTFLLGENSHETYAQFASRHELSESAVKMTVLRLRKRYQAIVREVIADTVSHPAEIDEELRHLRSVVAQ
jgi:RNA polymerase sigma-70 factor (ECF subfamily)